MIFELNNNEIEQIMKLSSAMREKREKVKNYNGFEEQSPRYFAEEKEMLKIDANAHERALKYYRIHLDELLEKLKFETKISTFFISAMEDGGTDKKLRLEAFLKENLKRDTAPYLEMLKENRPQAYDEIIAFIDYAFKHRAELYKKREIIIEGHFRNFKGGKTTPNKPQLSRQLPPSTALSLMFNGQAPTALGLARGKGKFIPETGVLKVEGINMFLPESVHKVGVGAAKIFRYAVAEFTERNSNKITREKINPRIFLDIKDFATANEVDINSESAMKNFRFKLKKDLDILLSVKITGTEKVKGQPRSYSGMVYIGKYELKENSLMIEFLTSMAEYLVLLPLIQYPRSLYKLDNRDYNAFAIGEAMCIHYSQDNNVIKGTEGKLRVENLLKYTSFPTYEELKENRWSWEERVKDRFEDALEKLYQCGFLKNRVYCYPGDIEITDEEMYAGAIDSYEKFASLLVKFELNDFEDHETRVTEIVKKKAESIKKLQTKQTKRKSSIHAH